MYFLKSIITILRAKQLMTPKFLIKNKNKTIKTKKPFSTLKTITSQARSVHLLTNICKTHRKVINCDRISDFDRRIRLQVRYKQVVKNGRW